MKYTKDIYLAAAFLALGAKLVGIDRTDRQHQEFQFDPQNLDLDHVINLYMNRELFINVNDYRDAFQRIKSALHSF